MDQPVICQQPDNKKSPGIDSVDSGFHFEEESQIKKPAEDTKTLTEEGAMGANAGGTTSSTTGDCCYYCNCNCVGIGYHPCDCGPCDCGNCDCGDCNCNDADIIFYILCCPCMILAKC